MTAPARELTKAVVDERPRATYGMCPWCGRPCIGRACEGHRDLVLIEHDLYSQNNGPARTPLMDARAEPSTKGA